MGWALVRVLLVLGWAASLIVLTWQEFVIAAGIVVPGAALATAARRGWRTRPQPQTVHTGRL